MERRGRRAVAALGLIVASCGGESTSGRDAADTAVVDTLEEADITHEDTSDTHDVDVSTPSDTSAVDTTEADTLDEDSATSDTIGEDTATSDTSGEDTAAADTATQDTDAPDTATQDTEIGLDTAHADTAAPTDTAEPSDTASTDTAEPTDTTATDTSQCATTCVPDTSVCVHGQHAQRCFFNADTGCPEWDVPVACEDDTVCNGVGQCVAGECVAGVAPDCPEDTNPCTHAACDPVGGCYQAYVQLGTPCGDGDVCNGDEVCDQGVCAPGPPLTCAEDDDPCTEARCDATLGCYQAPRDDGAPCDDDDLCDGHEVCLGGQCVDGAPLACDDDDDPCTVARCDPGAGCGQAPADDGTPCDDETLCDGRETCLDGLCQPGLPLVCAQDDNPCTFDRCDAALGCITESLGDGAPCDDADACNGHEQCSAGVCQDGSPPDCQEDANPCTAAGCDPDVGCVQVPIPDGASCDDDTLCNGEETCLDGQCQPGAPPVCDLGNPCELAGCDPVVGCDPIPFDDGTPCDDDTVCNGAETCLAGLCEPGAPLVCEGDDNPCTATRCDAVDGCVTEDLPDTRTCVDDDPCTVGDHCAGGACVSGVASPCDDDDPCTDDVCDGAGGCVFPPRGDGATCSDGDPCTDGDRCLAGECEPAGPTDCDDALDCTVDACATATGCTHTPDDGACADLGCLDARCDVDAGCVREANVARCADGDPCTRDVCEDGTGACLYPDADDGTACNDADHCTVSDHCEAGDCVSGGDLDCDDDEPCTVDACDPASGCTWTPRADSEGCDDADACTADDRCLEGQCVGDDVSCDDAEPCTMDACNAASGCEFTPTEDGTACEDGDLCTILDACAGGVCASVTPRRCADDDPCTDDVCEPNLGCVNAPLPDGTACVDVCATAASCDGGVCGGGVPRTLTARLGGADEDAFVAVDAVPGGGWVMAGTSASNATSTDDLWVVRADALGSAIWSRTYGAADTAEGAAGVVAVAGGGFAVLGDRESEQSGHGRDLWLLRLDDAGEMLWDREYHWRPSDLAVALAPGADGGWVLLCTAGAAGDRYGTDVWIIAVDVAGEVGWQRFLGSRGSESAAALARVGDGYAVAYGGTPPRIQRLDAAGWPVWDWRPADGTAGALTALAVAPDGTVAAAGARDGDLWTIGFDDAGRVVWDLTFDGGGEADTARALVAFDGGGFAAVGGSDGAEGAGGGDLWIVRLDASGNALWQRRHGGSADDVGRAALAEGDDLVIAGGTASDSAGAEDGWLLRADAWGRTGCVAESACGLLVARDCADGLPCSLDDCDPTLGCINLLHDGACGDADLCTTATTCDEGGACVGEVPACDDGDACTAQDACDAGACGGAPQCGGCVVDGDCEDGDFCTRDLCLSGSCARFPAIGAGPGAGGTDAVQLGDGGFAVIGSAGDDLLVRRLDAARRPVWERTYGDRRGSERGVSVTTAEDGDLVVLGSVDSSSYGDGNALVWRLSPGGDVRWATEVSGLSNDLPYYITALPDGGFAFTGARPSGSSGIFWAWLVRLDADGAVTLNKGLTYTGSAGGNGLLALPGGDLVMGGGSSGAWAVRVTPAGAVVWTDRPAEGNEVHGVVRGAPGQVALLGRTGDVAWLRVLTEDGELVSQRHLGYLGRGVNLSNNGFIDTPDGGFAVVAPTSASSGELVFTRLDPSGLRLWQRTFPGVGGGYHGVIATSSGGFGLPTLSAFTETDAWGRASCDSASECNGLTPADCGPSEQCRGQDCDPVAGCALTAVAAGTPCDDGLYCTVNDACSSGSCLGLDRDCSALDAGCDAGICDEGANACVLGDQEDGFPCEDDGDPCTVDACVAGQCTHEPGHDGATCADDGDPCTADVCDGGSCVHPAGHDGAACADEGDPCTADRCDGGVCSHPPGYDGRLCADEGDVCTQNVCDAGSCAHPPLTDDCTIAACGASFWGCADCGGCDGGLSCVSGACCDPGCADPGAGCVPCAAPTLCHAPWYAPEVDWIHVDPDGEARQVQVCELQPGIASASTAPFTFGSACAPGAELLSVADYAVEDLEAFVLELSEELNVQTGFTTSAGSWGAYVLGTWRSTSTKTTNSCGCNTHDTTLSGDASDPRVVQLVFRQHGSCSEPGNNPYVGRIYNSNITPDIWPGYGGNDVAVYPAVPQTSGDCAYCLDPLTILGAADVLYGSDNACRRGVSSAVIGRVLCAAP